MRGVHSGTLEGKDAYDFKPVDRCGAIYFFVPVLYLTST
jgi:hypothetical protein